MRSHFALLVVLLSLLVTGTAVVAGDVHAHSASGSDIVGDRTAVNQTQTNGTTIRITPRVGGDARWNISMEFVLHDENETAAFEQMGQDFKYSDDSDSVGFSAGTFRTIAKQEQVATGRTMKIRNVKRDYAVHNETGILYLKFTWTNFTRTSGGKIYLGDVFVYNDGESRWLRSLSANQHLVVENPDGYHIQTSNFGHNDVNLTLDGPGPIRSPTGSHDYVRVTYAKNNKPEEKPSSPFPVKYLAAFLVLAGVVGVGVYAFTQRNDGDVTDTKLTEEQPTPPPEPESEPEGDEPNLELLSDEERVEHLLEQSGGRMKQATIVKETNWSNAKVSQLLSAMNDEGRINKLRIGRENLITLPGEDVTDFDNE